ncbi:hypothetical protein ACOME3_007474 [Neoechinorhynchus agilis]
MAPIDMSTKTPSLLRSRRAIDNALLSLGPAAEGGKWPPTSLRIPMSPEVQNSILGDIKLFLNDKNSMDHSDKFNPKPKLLETKSVENPTDPTYISPPLQKWPHSISIDSNSIQSRDILYKMYLVPWLRSFNDDWQRIMKVTYFAGNLKVYLSNDIYKHQHKCYLESIKSPNVTFTNNSFDSTFLVSGLSPDIEEVDKKAFETKFGCKVLFFIKSRNNRLPIPRAVVKADIGTRDALLTQRCFFQWMEIFFTPTKFRNWTTTSFLYVLGVSNRDIGLSNVRKNDVFVHTVQDSIQARINYVKWAQNQSASKPSRKPKESLQRQPLYCTQPASTCSMSGSIRSDLTGQSTSQPIESVHSALNIPHHLDQVLNAFSANILKMVDLRISSAIQNFEKRLERHFEALSASLKQCINRASYADLFKRSFRD